MPSARQLILGLLLAAEGEPVTVQGLIRACALFEITANNVRVALARLVAEGRLQTPARGEYRLAPAAQRMADELASWRRAEARLIDWDGSYLAVHCPRLPARGSRAGREAWRALEVLGLRQLEPGLLLRPANLAGGGAALRERLSALGLDTLPTVLAGARIDAADQARVEALWDGAALSVSYRRQRQHLETWLAAREALAPERAAREVYLLGAEAVRSLVFDPWLPAPMVDTEARRAYAQTVKQLDAWGQSLWRELFSPAGGMPLAQAAMAAGGWT